MRRSLPLLLIALVIGCGSGVVDPPSGSGGARIVFVVDNPNGLNATEGEIRTRLESHGLPVVVIEDIEFTPADTVGARLVLVSKTVDDRTMGDQLKGCPCGVLFWHDNQQMLSQLATVANDGSDGAFWHRTGTTVWVRPEAPAALRDGLSGSMAFYTEEAEISYGRRQDVPASATVIAELDQAGHHKVIYLYQRGDPIGDGSPAAGKRLFFGLYRNTFEILTPEGRRLFDAALRWLLEG